MPTSVENAIARRSYEAEALWGGWSIRQWNRPVGSQFYERIALSKRKAAMKKGQAALPEDAVTAETKIGTRRIQRRGANSTEQLGGRFSLGDAVRAQTQVGEHHVMGNGESLIQRRRQVVGADGQVFDLAGDGVRSAVDDAAPDRAAGPSKVVG
jgi:hypothetical protein